MKKNHEGVQLIFNTVGSVEATTKDLCRLAFAGQLAHIAGAPNLLPFLPLFMKLLLRAAYNSGSTSAIKNLSFMAEELMKRVKRGDLNPLITEILPY